MRPLTTNRRTFLPSPLYSPPLLLRLSKTIFSDVSSFSAFHSAADSPRRSYARISSLTRWRSLGDSEHRPTLFFECAIAASAEQQRHRSRCERNAGFGIERELCRDRVRIRDSGFVRDDTVSGRPSDTVENGRLCECVFLSYRERRDPFKCICRFVLEGINSGSS